MKKAPKWTNVLMWGIVALRLLCPFSIESSLSLIPSAETVPVQILSKLSFDIQTGIAAIDYQVNEYLGDNYFEGVTVPANNGLHVMTFFSAIWLLGMLILFAYTFISYKRLRREVETAVIFRTVFFFCKMRVL